jgi:uncharacterized protein DUF2442
VKKLSEEEIDELVIAEADNDAAWEAPVKVEPSTRPLFLKISRPSVGDAMKSLPTVVQAEYGGDCKIQLTFNDGVEGTVDFTQWLHGLVFEPLKDVAYFQRFFLDGGTVAWPNGADIAPETLYEQAKANKAA